ncbi:hypothetical protein NKG99_07045 [Mesorhizobium sp. M1409]|uniref:hypothetical protein n=1 Tax=unclassified Mesorhizobium TaxID=325217 RepID=UPI00333D7647
MNTLANQLRGLRDTATAFLATAKPEDVEVSVALDEDNRFEAVVWIDGLNLGVGVGDIELIGTPGSYEAEFEFRYSDPETYEERTVTLSAAHEPAEPDSQARGWDHLRRHPAAAAIDLAQIAIGVFFDSELEDLAAAA